ncbi:Fucose permease [Proteiniphilum saccharofermentans]|uniref:Fucose permease n=1 Tax=Proteiniphilum saccharofermentans TaxID=1642647 RepID=A0A1R3T826_9BACT|nr:MFS transporter [Proteiniphilum saccharofermentans]SCD22249.1 Fucose permease [Proteiniphilum saccharofermentans]
MNDDNAKSGWVPKIAVFFGFFIMGFVDIVGIATNYVKVDFNLSSTLANTIPMMVFLWFAVFSIPAGILMGRIGKKKAVLLSLALTTVAMIIPFISYTFPTVLTAFALLGISNTILQVSLNPLVASMFTKEKTASVLTAGQFIKAISSLSGPIIAGVAANYFSDWKMTFVIFSITSLFSVLLLLFSKTEEQGFENRQSSFKSVLTLLKDKYILYCFLIILFIVGLDVGINTSAPELLMKRMGLELSRAGLGSSVYFAAKTTGAFIGTLLLLKFPPLRFLRLSLIMAIVAFIALMFVQDIWFSLILIFIIGFTCANVFSIVFSFALQKDQQRSNEISALMIMGVSGGAVILPLQGLINDNFGLSAALSVLLFCLIINLLLTNIMKAER